MTKSSNLRWARIALYATYTIYGVLHAAINAPPAIAVEIYASYDQIAAVWTGRIGGHLSELPRWGAEVGILPFFAFALPFLLVFGPVLLSLQLAAVFWNVTGALLLEAAFGWRRETLLGVALLLFASPFSTELLLNVNGGHTQLLLPLGLSFFLARRFLNRSATLSPRKAVAYGAAASCIAAFMLPVAVPTLVLCFVCIKAMGREQRGRLLKPLTLGAVLGLLLFLPLLAAQPWPYRLLRMKLFLSNLAWLLPADLPTFLSLPGVPAWGSVLSVLVVLSVIWAWRTVRMDSEPLLFAVTCLSLLMPLVILLSGHYFPMFPFPDGVRTRHLDMAWPFWALLMGAAALRFEPPAGLSQKARRALLWGSRAALYLACLLGLGYSAGALNWGWFGSTAQMPLATEIGDILNSQIPGCQVPSVIPSSAVQKAPANLQPTLAFLMPFGAVWHARVRPLTEALKRLDELPEQTHEPYLVGLGFFVCEGSNRSSLEAEAQLPDLLAAAAEPQQQLIEEGCQLARRWRAGEVYFHKLAWPLREQVVENRPLRLWEGWFRYRTQPLNSRRRWFPFTAQ